VTLPSTTTGAQGAAPDAVTALAPERLRADFPILARTIHGRPLVYLDSAATSQKPTAVLAAMDDYYRQHNANVHRGVYTLAAEATELYEGARVKVARFIGATDSREVVFTRGTTEAINLVARSWAETNLRAGDAVLLTEMEHHANLVPWHMLAARTGITLRFLRLTDEGTLDLTALPALLDERVKLVTFVHVSNALGTLNPVDTLVSAARSVKAKVLLDAAQSVPHQPVDVGALGVDFLAFSGHKMLGPTGIGVLWTRAEILEGMPPFLGGGEMIRVVTLEGSTYNGIPARFEAGTPPIAEAVGLAAAVDYLTALGMGRVHAHSKALTDLACAALQNVPGLRVYGPCEERGAALAFTMEGVHPHDLATILDTEGVAVRAGHHCTQPLHRRFGLTATARASFYVYNTPEDVDALIAALYSARHVFGLA
jgi:cysteine desulfurase / selenocysteine lyase